ncbi:MAG TPA: uracil-DNA glycosylase [Candidatus Eisenbacteria bacterium]|jgi:DNA polymerase
MTERDRATEAASIVHALIRFLERERAADGGEWVLGSARNGERASRAPRFVPASTSASSAEIVAGSARNLAGRERAAAMGSGALASEMDLFGEPAPAKVGSRTTASGHEPPAPTFLNPGGLAARAAIVSDGLPVLEEIAAEARACRKCGLCESRTQAVPGVGSGQSGIVFVGEAPGADEDAQGEPFVGRAGQLLTRIIQAMDDARLLPGIPLTRDTVYICNVLKCRPPENRNPLPHEIETCSPYLLRQLEALRPRVICCLGKFAAELLVGVKGTIGGLRGKVYRYRGAKLIVTYHPAACLRNPAYKKPVWEDMQLLAREYRTD